MKGGRGRAAFDDLAIEYLHEIRRQRDAIPSNLQLAQALGVHVETVRLVLRGKYELKTQRSQ
jgi:hypothetical protein